MSSDSAPDLPNELLDDFYAECDELLSNLRTRLTHFESAGQAEADPAAIEALHRSAHTFKGIAAIAGVHAAEQLAHAMEGLLRATSHAGRALSAEHVDLLTRALLRLEQIVTAHRLKQAIPAATEFVARLNDASAALTASGASAAARNTPRPTPSNTTPPCAWHASFAPSTELDRRGVNINTVRARLSALGEITRANPSITPEGRMRFDFTLALRESPRDLEAWQRDGVTLAPVLETTPPSPAPTYPPISDDAVGSSAPSSLFIAPSHIVRVDLGRLDELMRIVGEMVIHRSRLDERIAQPHTPRSELHEVNLALGRSLRELRGAITRVRLVPVAEIFARLPLVVRDLARDHAKKVRLVLEGQETEIDKYLVERLKEPLLHLVRNAISHGVETSAERRAAGKPDEATLRLRAKTAGQFVLFQIRDDGRGLDASAIVARARAAGILVSENPGVGELLDVICRPGFTTRDEADRAAGRGVGMAVVHTTIRELAGSLSVETEPGQWTQFTLRLPLTLSIAETFLVSAVEQICAVPQDFVEEIATFDEANVRTIEGVDVIPYRDGVLPVVRLRRLFGAERSATTQSPLLVLSSERGLCGLVVDRVHGQREVVVRAMHDPLIRVPGVSGATELGDGRPVLILDAVAWSSGAVRPHGDAAGRVAVPHPAVASQPLTASVSGS